VSDCRRAALGGAATGNIVPGVFNRVLTKRRNSVHFFGDSGVLAEPPKPTIELSGAERQELRAKSYQENIHGTSILGILSTACSHQC
jgi:hypothetical protein